MNRLCAALAASLLALAPVSALAVEKVVVLDGGLDATINIPDGSWMAPGVVMLHGFGSQKDEVGNMYAREAKQLADRGIASIRFSFRGYGKSDGDTGSATVDTMIEDALVATDYLAAQPEIDASRLGVLGFSLGGGVALMVTGQNPDLFKSRVTWSSVGDFLTDMVADSDNGQAMMERAMEEGVVALDLGFRTIALRKSFYESLKANDIAAALQNYSGAYLAIAGSEDWSSSYTNEFVEASPATVKKALVIEGTDHIYGVLTPDQTNANLTIVETADWFADTL